MRLSTLLARCLMVLFACSLMLVQPAMAQSSDGHQYEFKIHHCEPDAKSQRMVFFIKATDNGAPIEIKDRNQLTILETISGQTQKLQMDEDLSHGNVVEENQKTASGDSLHILFMVGAGPLYQTSQSLREALIQGMIRDWQTAAANVKFYLASYCNNEQRPETFDPSNLTATLSGLDAAPGTVPQLYRGIVEATRFANSLKSGKKMIALLTDGQNQDAPDAPTYLAPYTKEDIIGHFLPKLGHSVFFVPIGLPAPSLDTAFLGKMVGATSNPNDAFDIGRLPVGLHDKLARKVAVAHNNEIYCYFNDASFEKETRKYEATWVGKSLNDTAQLSGIARNYDATLSFLSWFLRWVGGLGLVFGLLGTMMVAIPAYAKRAFKKQFVKPYRAQSGTRHSDPLTGDPFKEGELVVLKCSRQITSLATWDYCGSRCPNYPGCMDFQNPCDGVGASSPGNERFFDGSGIFRRLNWLWFGMLGGLIGWSLFALFSLFNFQWYRDFIFGLLANQSGNLSAEALRTLTDETLLGATFGAGLCFALSWAEERSQPRKIGWGRIGLRTIFGLLASLVVFFLGYYLQFIKGFGQNVFFSGLITWLVFGLCIGFVLSIESSISVLRGLLGGVVAALLAYLMYSGLNKIPAFNNDFALAKMFSSLLMGAMLGLALVTVLTRLEDFELEYLNPKQVAGHVNPISKWLKNGIDIFIGREPGNYVWVKWEDESVAPYHARLFYEKGVVYVEPLAELLINGRLLVERTHTTLQNGDVLQFGRTSPTRMRYREKRTTPPQPIKPQNIPPKSTGGGKLIINQ